MGCLYSPQYTRHVLNTGRVPPRDIAVEFAVFEHAFHARGAGCVPLGNVAIELPVEAHGENARKVLDLGHVHVVQVAFEATHLEQRGDELGQEAVFLRFDFLGHPLLYAISKCMDYKGVFEKMGPEPHFVGQRLHAWAIAVRGGERHNRLGGGRSVRGIGLHHGDPKKVLHLLVVIGLQGVHQRSNGGIDRLVGQVGFFGVRSGRMDHVGVRLNDVASTRLDVHLGQFLFGAHRIADDVGNAPVQLDKLVAEQRIGNLAGRQNVLGVLLQRGIGQGIGAKDCGEGANDQRGFGQFFEIDVHGGEESYVNIIA